MRIPIALAAVAVATAVACSAASQGPRGWQPVPGAGAAWSNGSGTSLQEYSYQSRQFAGGLQDLASQVTIDALMRHRGAKLQGSAPFAPCPGAAGVATFRLDARTTLQEGFAVRDGRAILLSYVRPASTPVDPAVLQAMQQSLCAT